MASDLLKSIVSDGYMEPGFFAFFRADIRILNSDLSVPVSKP
ncbi:hypothetical protein D1AOALGA4SA_11633 [Olavius algarvensis Delta 1 endosymbiont]|nr:hypothetical protein D1AOALGA4SA_11633 [Olavius algarvensis Delta 1 endosymbiont]